MSESTHDTAQSLYSLENQLIYRLASLEATVTNSLKRIDEKIENFQKDFHHKHTNQAAATAALQTRVEANYDAARRELNSLQKEVDTRLLTLENFKREMVAKTMAVAAVIGLGWALFGNLIEQAIGRAF